ncbi:MAG TPA: alpha/beta hydrolase [Mycobacteriales bacterium]|nr:alpha/beta hydrolase [Mycobacteriales bacterium]
MTTRQTTVTANGLTFAALTCGEEGPLALCLHGFPDSPHTWDALLPELATAGFRAVAPWTRGYAPTEVPADGDYSGATLTADANALHEALDGDGDAVLVGHDWGAMTAYAAAASEPERWRRLVTIAVPPAEVAVNAFFHYRQLRRSFYVFLFQTPLAELVAGADDLRFIEQLWRDWSPTYDPTADLVHVKAALRDTANLAAAIGYYRAMFTAGFTQTPPAQPTLYLHGTDDGAFGIEGVEGTAAALSADSRIEIIDGAGHFLHLERPAAVNRLILDWLVTPSPSDQSDPPGARAPGGSDTS